MKTKQTWGWLAVGVLAAGLNAAYHDGGMEGARGAVDRVVYQASAVLALAGGQVNQWLSEAQLVATGNETASHRLVALAQGGQCQLATAMARVQGAVARSEAGYGRFEAMSAREEAQLARLEASQARMEARIAARTARWNAARARLRTAAFSCMPPLCPRMRVNIPPIPKLRIPAPPVVPVELPGAGPV